MFKLTKYLKPFIISIIFIVGLLFLQANSDLALPDYMSRIVNIGIQQGGIENAVPSAISKTEYERITFFMSDEDKAFTNQSYKLIDKNDLSASDYDKYSSKYPVIKDQAIYVLNTNNKNDISKLNNIMAKPILIVDQIEKKGITGMPPGTDPFAVLTKLPAAQLDSVKQKTDDMTKDMPESIITQGAVNYIRSEYSRLGVNTDKLQSSFIINTGFLMILVALLSTAATIVVSFLASRVAAGVGRNMRKLVFEKVVNFTNTEFDKISTASLITRCTNDIQQIQMFMVMLLRIVFYAPILGIGGVLKVLRTETSMGWIIAVAVAAILALVLFLFGVAIPKFKSVQKLVDKLNLVTRESLTGLMVIRAFNTQEFEEKKFDNANNNLTKTNLFVSRIMSTMFPLMMLIMNIITITIVWVGAHRVDAGAMQVGDMMAFIQYTMQIIMSFLMISMVSMMLPRASVSAARITEVIGTDISIRDPKEVKAFVEAKKGYVEFKNVTFRYPNAEENVLEDINFTAKPGETTAFIGSTGSGKTTLINLIPRFYDVSQGEILVDGVDIRQVPQQSLRDRIGYVPQKGILFSGTIESNLRYGKRDASDEEIVKSAEIAQALGFIKTKEKGFETEIAQGGTNVSGGQKQRLSIARALVKKPEIFIFDDSFSALDFKTDAELRKALKVETGDSTVLLVAQRISTIMGAEQIIVLEEGRIAGKGTHKELMENCEVYKQIALSQLSKEELA